MLGKLVESGKWKVISFQSLDKARDPELVEGLPHSTCHLFFPLGLTPAFGYRAEESPVRFYLGERKIEVEAILDRWLAPDHRYFKVRGDDKALYIIRHETVTDTWELTMFDRTGI